MGENRAIRVEGSTHGSVLIIGDRANVSIFHATSQQRPVRAEPLAIGPNPYRGLEAFTERDVDRFFGREAITQKLWERFRDLHVTRPSGSAPVRILPILGPSGSGKSSVARAGLMAELVRQPLDGRSQARVAVLTPSARPIDSLAGVLIRVAADDAISLGQARELSEELMFTTDGEQYQGLRRFADLLPDIAQRPLVILVDQFEQVYDPYGDEKEQNAFVGNLLSAAADRAGRVSVILTLRSDFLGHTQRNAALNHAIAEHGIIVPAMNPEELHSAIAEPASRAGHPLDTATIDLLIAETAGREGALPLLQFALMRIWEGMANGEEPAATLRRLGGVGGALASVAQRLYDNLSETEQHMVRRAFLSCVRPGEGIVDTRQRVAVSDLVAQGEASDHVRNVLRMFSEPEVRLITLSSDHDGTDTAEITHEALFEHWGTLRDWLDTHRDDLPLHRRIAEAANHWQSQNRPDGLLWRSPDLDLLRAFHERKRQDMTPTQVAFFQAALTKAKRTRWGKRLAGAVAGLLLCAMGYGIWYWDAHLRTYVRYYQDVVDRRGELEGIGRIANALVPHRSYTTKIQRRGRLGRVTEIAYINGQGRCPQTRTGAAPSRKAAISDQKVETNVNSLVHTASTTVCRLTFDRNAAGHVILRRAYDRDGSLVYEEYVDPENDTVHYRDEKGAIRVFGDAEATFVHYLRYATGPYAGLIRELRYEDEKRRPRPDANGIFGERFTYNELGFKTQTTFLGVDGSPMQTHLGITTVKTSYDRYGNATGVAWFDHLGQPTLGKLGFARSTKKYDKYGNFIEGMFFDQEGQPIVNAFGIAKAKATYDTHGNVIEEAFFELDDRPTLGPLGAAKHTVTYNANGEMTEMAFFGVDDLPLVPDRSGYARATISYDPQGRMTGLAYFSPDGQLMRHDQQGFAKLTWVLNAEGKVVEAAWFGADGQPTPNPSTGCAKLTHAYDEKGNEVETTCFDSKGQVWRGDPIGYAKRTRVYNDQDHVIEEAYLGTDGQPQFNDKAGYAKSTFLYDGQGRQIEQAFFGPDDHPVLKDGYAKRTIAFDPQGNVIALANFGTDGQLRYSEHKGYAKAMMAYDAQGNQIEARLFGADDLPLLSDKSGYAKKTQAYNAQGKQIALAFFGPDGLPMFNAKKGYAKITRTYDRRGKLLEEAHWETDGRPMMSTKTGFVRRLRTYNGWGDVVEERYLGLDGQPMLRHNRYAKVTFEYDEIGRFVKADLWDLDGQQLPPAKVTVIEVQADGKGAQYGLREGDFIIRYDGHEVSNTFIFYERSAVRGDRRRSLEIQRGSDKRELKVESGKLGLTLENR